MSPTEQTATADADATASDTDSKRADVENRYHHYTGNAIPWYVRLIWILFWVFAVYYALRYFLPTLQVEMVSPP